MNTDVTVSIAAIIAVIGCFVTVYNFYIARKKDTVEETRESGSIKESLLTANMKLDQVCATTNETRTDIKAMDKKLQEMDKRIIILEKDNEAIWKRVDELASHALTTE